MFMLTVKNLLLYCFLLFKHFRFVIDDKYSTNNQGCGQNKLD